MPFIEFIMTYWDWYLAIGAVFGVYESLVAVYKTGTPVLLLPIIFLLAVVLWPILVVSYIAKN